MTYARRFGDNKTFVIAAVIVGNALPVTEDPFDKSVSLKGKAGGTAYQSHYIVGESPCQLRTCCCHFIASSPLLHFHAVRNEYNAVPLKGNQPVNPKEHADELVIFQEKQALPLFVIYTKGF